MGNQQVTTVLTEAAVIVDGVSATVPIERTDWSKNIGPRAQTEVVLFLNVSAHAGTSPTLDVSVDWSMDGGITFAIPPVAQAFAQILEVDLAQVLVVPVLGDAYRLVYDIEGTTPSYTFTVNELVR